MVKKKHSADIWILNGKQKGDNQRQLRFQVCSQNFKNFIHEIDWILNTVIFLTETITVTWFGNFWTNHLTI